MLQYSDLYSEDMFAHLREVIIVGLLDVFSRFGKSNDVVFHP